jgi:hypothetical protein
MTPRLSQLVTGLGGVLLIVSLFLPWARVGGVDRTGFQVLTTLDVFLLIVALLAIATALTRNRFCLFRPDLSMKAATDLLALTATILLAYLLLLDFPTNATRDPAAFLALACTLAITTASGDYRPLQGAPWFPRNQP